MVGSFQLFQQRLDVVVILSRPQSHKKRRHLEGFVRHRLIGYGQPLPQEPIDSPLERVTGALDFLLYEAGNIVVDGESGSHIMMIRIESS